MMAMPLRRGKHPVIYPAVWDFFQNGGQIQFIAHLILNNGNAIALGAEEANANGGAQNHPDQQFWNQGGIAGIFAANAGNIRRVEVDCTLLPCEGNNSCTRVVPFRINGFRAATPIRFFGHRPEGPALAMSSKTYFNCTSNQANAGLDAARANIDGWGWVPWAGVGLGGYAA
jgi:hypothetical protein